jgi:hypothetical protein
MTPLKVGARLRSTTGAAEVIITKGNPAAITCAGTPMVPVDQDDAARPSSAPASDPGQQLIVGKRYQTPDGAIQVLCVKQGDGDLEIDSGPVEMVKPKLLPASD